MAKIKEKIVDYLLSNPGVCEYREIAEAVECFSQRSDKALVLRPHISALRKEGYHIGTVQNVGFTMDDVELSTTYHVKPGQGEKYLSGLEKDILAFIRGQGYADVHMVNKVLGFQGNLGSMQVTLSYLYTRHKKKPVIEKQRFAQSVLFRPAGAPKLRLSQWRDFKKVFWTSYGGEPGKQGRQGDAA